MIVSPQYEQTLMVLSWSALWLRRILFFDFDVFRFGCAIGYLLTILRSLNNRDSKVRSHNLISVMILVIFQHF